MVWKCVLRFRDDVELLTIRHHTTNTARVFAQRFSSFNESLHSNLFRYLNNVAVRSKRFPPPYLWVSLFDILLNRCLTKQVCAVNLVAWHCLCFHIMSHLTNTESLINKSINMIFLGYSKILILNLIKYFGHFDSKERPCTMCAC